MSLKEDNPVHVQSKISVDPSEYKSTSHRNYNIDPDCVHMWSVRNLEGPLPKYELNKTYWQCSKCLGMVSYERWT
jgi:hypothetical protein